MGEPVKKLSPEWHLYVSTVTASLSDKYYETSSERLEELRRLIGQSDPQFVARLAIYTREQMNFRSIPLVLAVELAKVHSGDALVGKMTSRIIARADEITELLAYYQMANERKHKKKLKRLSKQLQAGLKHAFNKFDEYQFAKYHRDTEIKFRDALFLVHPKAKDEAQQLIFNKIAENKLSTPYTWETELSALGKPEFMSFIAKQKAFAHKWEELIDSGKLGYMALLRNLRNIVECGVSYAHIAQVCETISARANVLKSKQFPFRFLAAYRELSKLKYDHALKVTDALEKAVNVAAENIAGFNVATSVLIACDVSGSMRNPISPESKIMHYDIGLMLGMLLKSRCENVVAGIFGDKWKTVNLPDKGILSNVDAFYRREGEVGYSTNGYLVVEDLLKRNIVVDKIMMFTDCRLWDSRNDGKTQLSDVWKMYKSVAPDAKLYLFDLAGHGQVPLEITGDDVHLIAGWSDKIFDILQAIENGSDALKEIKAIEI